MQKPTETTDEPADTTTAKGRRVDALKWLRAVQRESDLSMQARAIAAVLCTRMDPDGASCFPSLATIAADSGYTHGRTVAPYLTELERGGWVLRERRPRKGRDHATTRYSATIPIDPPSDGSVREAGGVVGPDRQGLSALTDNRVGADRHDLASDLATGTSPQEKQDPSTTVVVADDARLDDIESLEPGYLDLHNGPYRFGRELRDRGWTEADVIEVYVAGEQPDARRGVSILTGWRHRDREAPPDPDEADHGTASGRVPSPQDPQREPRSEPFAAPPDTPADTSTPSTTPEPRSAP